MGLPAKSEVTGQCGGEVRRRLPALRQHVRGHWFWREDGKDTYASMDKGEAERLWHERFDGVVVLPRGPLAVAQDALRAVSVLQTLLDGGVPDGATAQSRAKGSVRGGIPRQPKRTVRDVADRLLQLIDATCTHQRKRVYRFDMKMFLDQVGPRPLASLTADDLLSYRSSLTAKYKPWTTNHRLAIARRILRLADELGWLPQRLPPTLLKGVPVGETRQKAWSVEEINAILKLVATTNPNLARMMRLQFLACLRPFSVPEVVFRRGSFESVGVFVLDRSKTEKKTGEKQRICLTEDALAELERITPEYPNGPKYHCAVKRACDKAPHALRHSAATALAEADVPDEYIEVALGHVNPRVKRTYRPQKYQKTREHLVVLARLVPPIG